MSSDKETQAEMFKPAASDAAKPETVIAKDAPLPLDAPKLETKAESAKIDVASLIAPVERDAPLTKPATTVGEANPATAAGPSRPRLRRVAPLAAGIALATAVGAIAGAGTTLLLQHDSAATAAAASDTRSLQARIAQLDSDIAELKSGMTTSQRSAGALLTKLTERLDRAEKAQTEPAVRLAKLTETVDRLEKRQQQQSAALAAASAAAHAPTPSAMLDPDATGSVVPYKEESRPPVAEGWRLRDFYSGRAVVESRNGMLFEVGPGSNLPGLGRVETIKRENGRIVVVARNGIITASAEPRRPPAPIPYRY